MTTPPTLPALLVGYEHAGVPIKTRLKRSAKELFQNSSKDAIAVALDVVSPHILYQIGESWGEYRSEGKMKVKKKENRRNEGEKREDKRS